MTDDTTPSTPTTAAQQSDEVAAHVVDSTDFTLALYEWEKARRPVPQGDTWGELTRYAGRNDLPEILEEHGHDLLPDDLQRAVSDAWSSPDWPESRMPSHMWVEFFEDAGYTVNGELAERPESPLRLYRGATADRRLGMAWTDNLEVAARFASGTLNHHREVGTVWTAMVDPSRLLARIDDREEHEYVVKTDDLEVVEQSR